MTVADLKAYFAGGRVVKLAREGYEEPITIPKSDAQVVEQAAHDAVKAGTLWLTSGPTTLLMEDIPPGVLTDVATLQAPPPAISPNKILPDELAAAWTEGTTTARTVADARTKATRPCRGSLSETRSMRRSMHDGWKHWNQVLGYAISAVRAR